MINHVVKINGILLGLYTKFISAVPPNSLSLHQGDGAHTV